MARSLDGDGGVLTKLARKKMEEMRTELEETRKENEGVKMA